MRLEPGTRDSPLHIFDTRLHADPSRVVLRPFHLGWQAQNAPGGRAMKLVSDIASLSESAAHAEYAKVLADFEERHWQTENMFIDRFASEVGRADEEQRTDTRSGAAGH